MTSERTKIECGDFTVVYESGEPIGCIHRLDTEDFDEWKRERRLARIRGWVLLPLTVVLVVVPPVVYAFLLR